MKNILLLFVIILLYIQPVNAQKQLHGKITDKLTREPIIGATVYIPDLKTGAVTDTTGFYKIENLPKIKTIVQVNFMGYKTIAISIDLKTTAVINFEMEVSAAEMNEVVVTGTSKALEIKRSPIPIVVISRKEIDQEISTNIISAIANLPGISAVTTGPNVSKPYIHGLGYNRILTLYDGFRQEGQQWGDEHGIEVDEYSINRIEVLKGPASLTYGSDALAGVVNLIPFPPAPNGFLQGNILSEYQSNNGLIGASAYLSGNKNGFDWGGRISHKEATNYQDKYDGRVYGTAFNETDASGYIGLNKKWGNSYLNFALYDDLQEIPDGSRDSATRKFTKQITEADTYRPIVSNSELNSYNIATLHQHVQHYRVNSSNNFILGSGKLEVNVSYQQSDRREYSHPEAADIPGLYLVLNTLTYDIKYFLPEFHNWETTVGVNGMYQNNNNEGTEFIIPDYNEFDLGPFAHIKKSFKKLDISAGIRYDVRFFNNDQMFTRPNPITGFDMQVAPPDTAGANRVFSNYQHTFSGFSGSMGGTYNINDNLSIKANIARGYRAPNISEISANGVHPGTNIYQIGNPNFSPEFSLQEDLGINYTSSHVNGYVEIFNNNINNYIFNQKLLNHVGTDSVIVKGNETFLFQQSQAEIYGAEASIDIHPHPLDWLHFENAISITYGINKGGNGIRITDSSKYLPFIPPLHYHSELRANIKKKFRNISSIYAKIEMDCFAKQDRAYLAYNTETVTPGYTLFNVGAGTDFINRSGKVLFHISIAANNIFNIAYQSNMSRLKYFEQYPVNWTGRSGIYEMGRNVGFKVIIPISGKI